MPQWNDLTDAERNEIIAAVFHDETWDAQIALDVYNRIRRVMQARSELLTPSSHGLSAIAEWI